MPIAHPEYRYSIPVVLKVSDNFCDTEESMVQADGESKETKETATVSSEEARASLGELLARAGHKDERIVITLYGREHAALVGLKDLYRLRELDGAA